MNMSNLRPKDNELEILSKKQIELKNTFSRNKIDKMNLEMKMKSMEEELKLLKDPKKQECQTQSVTPQQISSINSPVDKPNKYAYLETKQMNLMNDLKILTYENETLKARNARLTDENNQSIESIDSKKKEIIELSKSLESTKQAKIEQEAEIVSSKTKYAELKRMHDSNQDELKIAEETIKNLTSELENSKREHASDVELQQSKLKENDAVLEGHIKTLTEQRKKFIDAVQMAKEEIHQSMKMQMEAQQSKISQDAEEVEKNRLHMKSSLDTLTKVIEDQKLENTDLKKSTEKNLLSKDQEIIDLKREVTELRKNQKEQELKCSNYMDEQTAENERLNSLIRTQDKEFAEQKSSQEEQIRNVHKFADEMISEKTVEVSKLISENSELKMKFSQSESKLTENETSASILWEKYQSLNSTFENQKDNAERMESELKLELNTVKYQLSQSNPFNQPSNQMTDSYDFKTNFNSHNFPNYKSNIPNTNNQNPFNPNVPNNSNSQSQGSSSQNLQGNPNMFTQSLNANNYKGRK